MASSLPPGSHPRHVAWGGCLLRQGSREVRGIRSSSSIPPRCYSQYGHCGSHSPPNLGSDFDNAAHCSSDGLLAPLLEAGVSFHPPPLHSKPVPWGHPCAHWRLRDLSRCVLGDPAALSAWAVSALPSSDGPSPPALPAARAPVSSRLRLGGDFCCLVGLVKVAAREKKKLGKR